MRRLVLALSLIVGLPAVCFDAPVMAETIGTVTGLPIPRYVTLRSSQVNVRAGPGSRYPIEWVFQRPDLPVEVVSEFDTWRKIRDVDGTEGWVHQSMLSGRRAVIVLGQIRTLHRAPDDGAPAVARLEPGVIGKLEVCQDEWCEIEISGFDGWIHRSHIWGVRADEALE